MAVEEIGIVEQIFRYPIKSMVGEALDSTALEWAGVVGDRRLALWRTGNRNAFPWLNASRWPRLSLYAPWRGDGTATDGLPTHVRTPDGRTLGVFDPALAEEIGRESGFEVEMLQLKLGVPDEAPVSVISSATMREIANASDTPYDVRRFRPNFVVDSKDGRPFCEDQWVGRTLRLGDEARFAVTMRDVRCSTIGLDPDTAVAAPGVLKTTVRLNETTAGVYATVIRLGRIAVGDRVFAEQ